MSLKMASARTRTSLGRTSLDLNLGLPPSPERIVTQQSGSAPTLSELMRRQTPRSQQVTFASPAIPEIEEEAEQITSVSDLVRSRSLDEELLRGGYTPISKMVVVTPKGEPTVRYVKAQNQLGEPVYIAVDVNDSYISQSAADPRFRESRIPINIGNDDKEMAFTRAGLGVSGVAMECNKGLCTIMHDEQMKAPREQNFVLIHTKKTEETFVMASFPVVRMSDIRLNPLAVQKNIDCALRKMRNAALSSCLCCISSVEKKFEKTCQLFKETLDAKEKVIKEFHRTMTILEDAWDNCSKCPEKNCEKLKEIAYNIEKRNSKFPALMESCREIASLNDALDEVNCTLEAAKLKLNKKFCHLHCAYELKDRKKHCLQRCVWEDQVEDDSDIDD